MALVNCPECGKEISDKAKSCVNCGYKIPHPEKKEQIKKYVKIAGACAVAIVLIMVIYNAVTKVHSPFDKFKQGMNKADIHEMLGEPDHAVDDSYKFDYYNNAGFCGLIGELSVQYYNNSEERMECVRWYYTLNDGETFSDYTGYIDKITKFFTKEYGEPSEGYKGSKIWKDSLGQEYTLRLDEYSDSQYLDPTITITYNP